MKKQIKVSPGYVGLNPSALFKLGSDVIESLTGNANFTLCAPFLAAFTTANTALSTAIAAQKLGDKASTEILHNAEEEVKRFLRFLAATVEFEANNDATKILTTSFTIKTSNGGNGITSFKAKQGKQSGTIEATSPSYNRAAYLWYVSPDPIGAWTIVDVSTVSKFTYKNLAVGVKHWVKVVVKQGEETVLNADPIMIHVV